MPAEGCTNAMVASRFLLKTAPPKPGRALPARPRLERRWADINDRTAILVTAPQGFGKTMLLAHWRRRWLERGALVAWATLDAQDERSQFADLLAFALRSATGRDAFTVAAMQGRLQEHRELDALTALLAEVAGLATPTVVILDDAHRMSQLALCEMLSYLLNNAPPNLQFVVGSRRPLDLTLADLLASGQLASIGVADLRLDADESREVLRARFGCRISLDDAARIHELTEGWPLGLQLAAATIEAASNQQAAIGQLSARRGDINRFFFESMLSRASPDEAAFVVRISILESMNADLCAAVTGYPDAARVIDAAALNSPVVTQSEDRQWIRLHAMARDFLLGHFDKLPVEERRGCYERAAAWYADHGQFEEAARHAWAAGNEALAVAHATRCLRDIAREGRLGEARDWIRRVPDSVMARDVGLQVTGAWISALGDDPEGVPAAIERILQLPDCNEAARFEAAMAAAAAAIFCDKPGLVPAALQGWDDPPPGATPLHVMSMANSRATVALHSGEAERARQLLCPCMSSASRESSMRLPMAFADMTLAISSYLGRQPVAGRGHPATGHGDRRARDGSPQRGRRDVRGHAVGRQVPAWRCRRGARAAGRPPRRNRARGHAGPDRARLSSHRRELRYIEARMRARWRRSNRSTTWAWREPCRDSCSARWWGRFGPMCSSRGSRLPRTGSRTRLRLVRYSKTRPTGRSADSLIDGSPSPPHGSAFHVAIRPERRWRSRHWTR